MANPSPQAATETTRAPHQSVDPLVAPPRPPAVAADGDLLSSDEMEAAAELSRVARRIGLDKRGVNGFRLYALYRAAIRLADRASPASRRPGTSTGKPR